MNSRFRAHLVDLTDFDRQCLARIRQRLELGSNALAVRVAIRDLARRLDSGQVVTVTGQQTLMIASQPLPADPQENLSGRE